MTTELIELSKKAALQYHTKQNEPTNEKLMESHELTHGQFANTLRLRSRQGRALQPGEFAVTDFNGHGAMTRVEIMARRERRGSQSGIQFLVRPALRNSTLQSWIDADWFEPAPPPNA